MSYTIQVSRTQLERIKNGLQHMDTIDPPAPDDYAHAFMYSCALDTLSCDEGETIHGWNI